TPGDTTWDTTQDTTSEPGSPRQVVPSDLVDARRTRERHREVELGEHVRGDGADAVGTGEREAVDPGAAEQDGVGAEREGGEDVGAAADAGVEQDGCGLSVRADGVGDGGEGVERRDGVVDLTSAVVGDHDAVGA